MPFDDNTNSLLNHTFQLVSCYGSMQAWLKLICWTWSKICCWTWAWYNKLMENTSSRKDPSDVKAICRVMFNHQKKERKLRSHWKSLFQFREFVALHWTTVFRITILLYFAMLQPSIILNSAMFYLCWNALHLCRHIHYHSRKKAPRFEKRNKNKTLIAQFQKKRERKKRGKKEKLIAEYCAWGEAISL